MAQGTRSLRRGELLAILGEIYRDKETGTLVLQQGQVSKFLYAQEGNLIFAASNSPEDKFTQILIDKGKLTADQLALAQEKKEGRTIGRTLVEMGFLGSEDLLEALISQMRKIGASVLSWDSGFAAFKPGILPPNLAKLPISTPRFIVDTALTIEDRDWAAASLGRLEIPIQIIPANRDLAKTLTLTADEIRLLDCIDGHRNARQICLDADVNLFSGVRFLIGLYYLGWIIIEQAPGQKPAKEAMDLSFLDKVATSPAPVHPVGEVPVTPRRLPPEPKAGVTPPVEPEPLPFEVHEEAEELKPAPEPEPLPEPEPQAEPEPLPKPGPAAPPTPVPFSLPPLVEAVPPAPRSFPPGIVAEPDLLAPLGEDEEPAEGEELSQGDSGEAQEEEEEPRPRRLGKFIGIFAATALVTAGLVIAVLYFVGSRTSDVPIQLQPSAAKPNPSKPGPTLPSPSLTSLKPGEAGTKPVPSTAVKPPEPKPAEPKPAPAEPKPIPTPKPVPTEPKPAPTPKPAAVEPKPIAPPKPAPPPLPKPSIPTPTPSPAGLEEAKKLMAAGDYGRAAQACQRAMGSKKGGFTINVEVACQAETVAKGLAAAEGNPDYMILPYDLKGRSCYRVIWGHFADRSAAEAALKSLPAFFKQGASPQIAPWK